MSNEQNSPKGGSRRPTGPTLKSLKEEIAALRKQCVDNSNGHTEVGAAFARRLDRIEAFMAAMPDANPQLLASWESDLMAVRGDIEALKARMSAVERMIYDPKAKGSLPKAYKGMEKAHKRITALGEALHGDIAAMKLVLDELQAGRGSKGIITELRSRDTKDKDIKDVLKILGDDEVDITDTEFVVELYGAFAAFSSKTDGRLTDLEHGQTTLTTQVNGLNAKVGELSTQVTAIASANGGTSGTPRWGIGFVVGIIAGITAGLIAYNGADLSRGWSVFTAVVIGVAGFWLAASFEKQGSYGSAFATAFAEARASKKPQPPAPPVFPAPNVITTQPNPTVSAGASS